MTNAMKRLLRDLCGYVDGNVHSGPKNRVLLVSDADLRAAKELEAIGIAIIGKDGRAAARLALNEQEAG